MSLDGAITNLASWAGNTMMPTMAGLFFAGAVYRYSKSGPFEQLLYGGFASLMCSGMLRALEGFVQHAGATNADAFWMATMSLVNWTSGIRRVLRRFNHGILSADLTNRSGPTQPRFMFDQRIAATQASRLG